MRIVIDREGVWERAAVIDTAGDVLDVYVDRVDRPLLYGGIYQGKIIRRLPQRAGVLINIGEDRTGWLSRAEFERFRPYIRGQKVIVQVYRDEVQDKSPCVTCDIRLSGRFVIFRPATPGLSFSRRYRGTLSPTAITSLTSLDSGGWILRSDAVSIADERILEEAERLVSFWRQARPKTAEPVEILPGYRAAINAILETARITRVEVSNPQLGQTLNPWLARWRPDLTAESIAGAPDLEELWALLKSPTVSLACGGSIEIESTKALIAIDVNQGSSLSSMTTNLNAAREIPRQIRLRNLRGTFLLDFIRLKPLSKRRWIEQELRRGLERDPRQTHIYGWTNLGLFELTRVSRGHSLTDLFRRD